MATFSVNQVRQLYVAKDLKSPNVIATDLAGSIAVKSDSAKNHLYFEYKGADNLMRSDLIDIAKITSIKATDASALSHELKSVLLTLDSTINEGVPVVGQDYILRIAFRQYIGMSDEDQYFKYGVVHAYNGLDAKTFYLKLAESLVKNFCRELVPLVKIGLKTSDSTVWVDKDTNFKSLYTSGLATAEYTGIVLEEAIQEWTLGIKKQVPVYFTVQPTTIVVGGDEVIWGVVEDAKLGNSINNGHTIADLEYFCMGERGDIYRGIAWPHNIPTKYLVDPDTAYNVIDINYYYSGNNEGVQRSQKTITLVVPKVGENNSTANALTNSIIGAINTATGLTVETLDASGS